MVLCQHIIESGQLNVVVKVIHLNSNVVVEAASILDPLQQFLRRQEGYGAGTKSGQLAGRGSPPGFRAGYFNPSPWLLCTSTAARCSLLLHFPPCCSALPWNSNSRLQSINSYHLQNVWNGRLHFLTNLEGEDNERWNAETWMCRVRVDDRRDRSVKGHALPRVQPKLNNHEEQTLGPLGLNERHSYYPTNDRWLSTSSGYPWRVWLLAGCRVAGD